jgi:hypothetical protein
MIEVQRAIHPLDLHWIEFKGTKGTMLEPGREIIFWHPELGGYGSGVFLETVKDFCKGPMLKINVTEYDDIEYDIGAIWAYTRRNN